MGDGVGEKTRKWGRKHGVGFFHAAAVIAATEGGTMPEWQIKDASGDGCGATAAEAGKNSHFWSRFVVLDLLVLSPNFEHLLLTLCLALDPMVLQSFC